MYKSLILKKGRENVVRRKHPWIFSRAIVPGHLDIKEGEVVRVLNYLNQFIAIATYHHSNIALRILSRKDETIDKNFFINKLQSAINLRKQLGLPSKTINCYRLIHGEGDGLSGLIIDIYHQTAVLQFHHIGMHHFKTEIGHSLRELYQKEIKYIYLKNDRALRAKFDNVEDDYLDIKPENSPSNLIIENGINFHIDWQKGQKTGFFLDQRENRKLLLGYCYNRKVLNCFSYSGGFSLYALTGGASHVESVDISGTALELLNKNVNCNPFQGTHLSHQSDVMQFLKSQPDASWDLIVVDPPAFAKNISKKHNAVIAYKRLNALALKKIKPGGILFTFSCSQVVNTELFYNTITAASIESQRNIRALHKLMQGPDHPINIFHPEGSYLKGLVLYVE